MDAKLFGQLLTQSIALLGEREDQRVHIANEFGLESSVLFVTNLLPEDLTHSLNSCRDLYQTNCGVTPVKKMVRDSFPGESTINDSEFAEYFRDRFNSVAKRAFPKLTLPQRFNMRRDYASRFELYSKKTNVDNTEFLKSTAKLIEFFCNHNVSFSMPSAVGINHENEPNICYAFNVSERVTFTAPTCPLIIRSDVYRPVFTPPKIGFTFKTGIDRED